MGRLIEDKYREWEKECQDRFDTLKRNEEELNRIFIEIYGLQDELSPEEDDKDVTVRLADKGREIRSLISYLIGIDMGRYSLDVEGLAYAGGDWDSTKYKTWIPNHDGIEILNGEFFGEKGMDSKLFDLIRKIYGDDTFESNISFIAEALDGKGSPRDVIRNYLLSGFYPNHLKIYQKRPIYWLFDAGKKNSFKALVYIHRYTPDTLAILRTDYILPLLERYGSRVQYLEKEIVSLSGPEQNKVRKELETLKGQYQELVEYETKVHHFADQRIALDLDDGVKVNYAKLQDILAPIK